jgi:hypothetical protein
MEESGSSLMPALREPRQNEHEQEFNASLSYLARPVSKKQKNEEESANVVARGKDFNSQSSGR